MRQYEVEPILSSPDPIGELPEPRSASNSPFSSRSRDVRAISPRKQTFELNIGQSLSPQRLRVTVEADSSSDKENSSPARNVATKRPYIRRRAPIVRKERTTTTIVRVKGLSDGEDERGDEKAAQTPKRGRPRKINGTPVVARTGRVAAWRRGSVGDRNDENNDEYELDQLSTSIETKRCKGRPRSRSVLAEDPMHSPAESAVDESSQPGTLKRGRSRRRKTLVPDEILMLPASDDIEVQTPEPQKMVTHTADPEPDTWIAASPSLFRIQTPSGESALGMNLLPDHNIDPYVSPVDDKVPYSGRAVLETNSTFSSVSPQTVHEEDDRHDTEAVTGNGQLILDARDVAPPISCVGPVASDSTEQDQLMLCDETGTNEGSIDGSWYSKIRAEGQGDIDDIAESEGFSMISVESVSSLRQHLSSPPQRGSERKVGSQANYAVEQHTTPILTSRLNDSFSSVAPSMLEAATRRPTQKDKSLLARTLRSRHSVEAISVPSQANNENIIPRAEPRNKLLFSKALRRGKQDDSFSGVPSDVLEAASPVKETATLPEKKRLFGKHLQRLRPDESFSSVPRDVLEAASPLEKGLSTAVLYGKRSDFEIRIHSPEGPEKSLSSVPKPARNQSRLVTPADTPSPDTFEKEFQTANNQTALSVKQESSSILEQMQYSPPLAGLRRPLSSHPSGVLAAPSILSRTPFEAYSSPTLPLLKAQSIVRKTAEQSSPLRNEIQSTLKAGRALQNIMVPPSRITNRSQDLGSPFKSPSTRRMSTQEVAAEPEPLRDLSDNQQVVDCRESEQSSKLGHDMFAFSSATKLKIQRSLTHGQSLAGDISNARRVEIEDPFRIASQDLSWDSQAQENLDQDQLTQSQSMSDTCTDRTVPLESGKLPAKTAESQVARDVVEMASSKPSPSPMVWEEVAEEEELGPVETLRSQPEPNELVTPKHVNEDKTGRKRSAIQWGQRTVFKQQARTQALSLQSAHVSEVPSSANGDEASASPRLAAKGNSTEEHSKSRESSEPPRSNNEASADGSLFEMSQMWHVPQRANFAPRARPRQQAPLDLSLLLGGSSPANLPRACSPPPVEKPSGIINYFWSKARATLTTSTSSSSPQDVVELNEPSSELEHDLENNIQIQFESEDNSTLYPASDSTSEGRSLHTPSLSSSPSLIYPLLNNVKKRVSSAHTPSPKKSILRRTLPGVPSPVKTVVWAAQSSHPSSHHAIIGPGAETPSEVHSSSTHHDASSPTPVRNQGFTVPEPSIDPKASTPSPVIAPTPAPSAPIAPLSRKKWSIAHWQLLQTLYHDIQASLPLDPKLEASYATNRFLGTTLSGLGDSFIVEAWHLDVISCLVDELGGPWEGEPDDDEGPADWFLIKRVAGLVVGGRRRARKAGWAQLE